MRFLIRSHTVPHTYEVAGLAYEVADLGERVGGDGVPVPCRFIYVVYKSYINVISILYRFYMDVISLYMDFTSNVYKAHIDSDRLYISAMSIRIRRL